MHGNISKRLRPWECALLAALSFALCAGAWAQGRAERLDASVLRLHVLAASDESCEQELKLRVRDAVLDRLAVLLDGADSRDEAEARIAASLDSVRDAALSASEGREVAVSLSREHYPTRYYGSVALPEGDYDSLRVVIGEGAGRNWWCVVFPPVCLTAAEDADGEDAEELLSPEDFRLLSADGKTCFRFRLLELWGRITAPKNDGKETTG